jgi:hypothetical protein
VGGTGYMLGCTGKRRAEKISEEKRREENTRE